MFVVDKRKDGIFSLPAQNVKAKDIAAISSPLATKILKVLVQTPSYPIELAKKLKVHEQKIYYHIRNLEAAGIIAVDKEEQRQGAVARYYKVVKPALVVALADLEPAQSIVEMKSEANYLAPFITDGQLDAIIIVGSPDPHGPEKARSRDGYYGMDLALFIGTFLNYVPKLYVKLDTEVREEDLKKNNLIIIGGPVVNSITQRVNDALPVRFVKEDNWTIKSTLSSTTYPQDEIGIVVKTKNPFNSEKSLLVVAGKRHAGTRAAIVSLLHHFKEISQGNVRNKKIAAKVVEGIDLDSDGIIDDAEVRE